MASLSQLKNLVINFYNFTYYTASVAVVCGERYPMKLLVSSIHYKDASKMINYLLRH
jgi:hypothetical protein